MLMTIFPVTGAFGIQKRGLVDQYFAARPRCRRRHIRITGITKYPLLPNLHQIILPLLLCQFGQLALRHSGKLWFQFARLSGDDVTNALHLTWFIMKMPVGDDLQFIVPGQIPPVTRLDRRPGDLFATARVEIPAEFRQGWKRSAIRRIKNLRHPILGIELL